MGIIVTLENVQFSGLEVPENISFGGDQKLTVHELVGGARVVDAMGRSDAPLEWSGYFMGPTALERARYVDGLRVAGKAVPLNWSELAYNVVVQSFRADFRNQILIPYTITCVVVEDQTQPVTALAPSSIDDAMGSDMDAANGYGDQIGDNTLSGLLGTLDTAIGAVSSFANAAQATINTVLVPIAAVQSRVTTLIASATNTVQNIGTVGGVLPNTPITQAASSLIGQAASFNSLTPLYGLQSVVGRMSANLGSVSGASQVQTVAGGNLFQIASEAYGDADSWTAIAKANGLIDPVINGLASLKIPAKADTTGGLLGV